MSSEPSRTSRLGHLAALDGLRGLAVVAVLCFHAGFSWARGGFLGVSMFFTLSGFLITSLLLREWGADVRIDLRAFWSRRFRRLMPAALATLGGVCVLAWLIGSHEQLYTLRLDVWAALAYVANWRFVVAGRSYADLWSQPSPVQHFWSLAVEEQFYLIYPLVAFGALRLGGRRLLGAILAVGAGASVLWGLHLRDNLDRVYYGTDTRGAELLVGGLLALWWTARPAAPGRPATGRGRVAVASLGGIGLAGSVALWPLVSQTSGWVTGGLLPLQAALSVAVIAAAVRPGPVGALLSWRPLAAVGLVSYGVYLYHWPVFLVLDAQRTHLAQIPLFALRVAVTAAVAGASYAWLEQPIRRRRVLVGRPGPVHRGPAVARPEGLDRRVPIGLRVAVPSAFGAAVAGAAAVAVVAAAVTIRVPPSTVAYADVQLAGHVATVEHLTGGSTSAAAVAPIVVAQAAAGSTSASSSTSTSVAAGPVPSAVMIVGDSGMFDVSLALGAMYGRLGTATIINTSWPGFGLTRNPAGWHHDWPPLVAANRPKLVVVMLGGWDWRWVAAHGVDAYDSVLSDAARVLSASGAHILWLGVPPGGNARPDQIDPLFERFVAAHPGTSAYADPAPAVTSLDGHAPRWLPAADGHLELLRKPDDWHFCADGAVQVARLAGAAAAQIGWAPSPIGGWEQGTWRADHRYNDPAGGCDPRRPGNAPPS